MVKFAGSTVLDKKGPALLLQYTPQNLEKESITSRCILTAVATHAPHMVSDTAVVGVSGWLQEVTFVLLLLVLFSWLGREYQPADMHYWSPSEG